MRFRKYDQRNKELNKEFSIYGLITFLMKIKALKS